MMYITVYKVLMQISYLELKFDKQINMGYEPVLIAT